MFWDDKEIKNDKLEKKERKREVKGKKPAKKKSKTSRWILNILIFLFACIFIYSAYRLYNIFIVYHHNAKVNSEVQDILYDTIGSDSLDYSNLLGDDGKPIDIIAELRKVNADIIGWIRVDDTNLDYPVVYGRDYTYYLNHNVYKEESIAGAVFMDYHNSLGEPLQNYILYAHRMKDQSMFGNLVKFLDEDFYNSHPTFTLILPDGYYSCEVFSVYQTTTYGFEYNITRFGTEDSYLEFVEACKQQNMYGVRDVEIGADDIILTLSTCDYDLDVDEGRLVVQAKLVKQGDMAETTETVVPEADNAGE